MNSSTTQTGTDSPVTTKNAPKAAVIAAVVNDDSTQRQVLSELLTQDGIEVRAFESAMAALEGLDLKAPPDLIVTDLYMPGIDGWRFCRLLRSPEYAPFNRVPILVVSAIFAGDEVARITADLGANAFLASPVDRREFGEQVRMLLRGERPQKCLRVLIVEDDKDLAGLLKVAFEANGYWADIAVTGREAEDKFKNNALDVVVLDHHLADTQGDKLLVTFKQQRPDTVYLAMTGDSRPELALEWMKLGAAAYVNKPFAPQYLIELCAKARRERELLQVEDRLEARTRELRWSEAQQRHLLRNLGAGVMVHAPDTAVRVVNQEASRLLGLSLEQMLGKVASDPVWRLVREDGTPLPREGYPVVQAIVTRQPLAGFVVGIDRPVTEDRVWVLVNAFPEFDDSQMLCQVVVTFSDITGRKGAEEEREKLRAQLTQAHKMESIGRLAGGVAHDFNNMLQAILGNVDLALEEIPPGSPLRENLEQIRRCARSSADLTQQLLGFARRQTVTPKVLNLNATLEGVLKLLRRLIGEDIDLVWQPGRDLWPVKIDPGQIDQVLTNLCLNARDAIAGVGKVILKTENAVIDKAFCAAQPDFVVGDYVLLVVSDNGRGLDKEMLGHLFEPFFTTQGVGHGTGLGLATVYGIIKQNRGFIIVNSEPGHGTAFKIYLPRHAESVGPCQVEGPAQPAGRGHEMILLVEDEPAVLQFGKRALESLGYTVLVASTPGEAIGLAELHAGKLHLLITDVVMPEMNGRDLAKRLLLLYPNLKRLFMSGYTADVIAHHGVLDEGVQFLQKPFTVAALEDKVREALETK